MAVGLVAVCKRQLYCWDMTNNPFRVKIETYQRTPSVARRFSMLGSSIKSAAVSAESV